MANRPVSRMIAGLSGKGRSGRGASRWPRNLVCIPAAPRRAAVIIRRRFRSRRILDGPERVFFWDCRQFLAAAHSVYPWSRRTVRLRPRSMCFLLLLRRAARGLDLVFLAGSGANGFQSGGQRAVCSGASPLPSSRCRGGRARPHPQSGHAAHPVEISTQTVSACT